MAGLYNGALQAVHWKTGQKENFEFFEIRANRTYPNFMKTSTGFEFLFCLEELLRGRHGDEVIAVALNEDHILSGSGDPGYYDRRPLDASVRLWRRSDGAALGCFEGHADSVRCVALFKTQPLMRCGMSGSLDCHLILWNLTNGSVESSSLLNGPCRCMSVLCEDVDSDTSGARARILAGSGEGVAELALTVRQGAVTVTQLRFVSAYVDVSSLSYFDGGYRQEIEQGSWPKSFLATPMRVAVGSVDGQFALLQGGSCRAVHELFKSRHGNCDVVSIVAWHHLSLRPDFSHQNSINLIQLVSFVLFCKLQFSVLHVEGDDQRTSHLAGEQSRNSDVACPLAYLFKPNM